MRASAMVHPLELVTHSRHTFDVLNVFNVPGGMILEALAQLSLESTRPEAGSDAA